MYFVALVLFGSVFAINLIVAVIFIRFRHALATESARLEAEKLEEETARIAKLRKVLKKKGARAFEKMERTATQRALLKRANGIDVRGKLKLPEELSWFDRYSYEH